MVAASKSPGVTARQAKRKDWWKVRRAKSKAEDGSTDVVTEAPDDTGDTETVETDVSTEPASVGIKQEDAAKVKNEKGVIPETEAATESTGVARQSTETPSGAKRKKRKISSTEEKLEAIHQVEKVEETETLKESKAAKRRRRLQKLKLYRSQETSSATKTKGESPAKTKKAKSEVDKNVTEDVTQTSSPRKTRSVSQAGPLPENKDKSSQQPGQKKKKGKFPKLYIAFVGNLPYDVKGEDIKWHFNKEGGVKAVRMLTAKDTAKPRGCAFVEFIDNPSLMKGVDLHHSQLGWRTINVEVSSRGKKQGSKTQPRSRVGTKSRAGRKKTMDDNSLSNETQSAA